MNQEAHLAITKMLNAFPQSATDIRGLLLTYDEDTTGIPDAAIIETASRFRTGSVSGQSKTFVPSMAEFITEARRVAELQAVMARPRLPPPDPYRPGPLAPYQIKTQQKWAENSHLPVLFTDVTLEQWKLLSAAKDVPVGAKWVAALGVVFGPAPKPSE